MRSLLLNALAAPAASILFLTACTNSEKPEYDQSAAMTSEVVSGSTGKKTQADIAEDHNNAKFDKAEQKDAQFVVDVAILNMSEIEMGNYVISETKSSSVKDLARKVTSLHTQLYDELNSYARKNNITVPSQLSDKDSRGADKLRDEKQSIDKKYYSLVVSQHKKLVDLFETAAVKSESAELKDWAGNKLPSIRKLLDQSMVLNESLRD